MTKEMRHEERTEVAPLFNLNYHCACDYVQESVKHSTQYLTLTSVITETLNKKELKYSLLCLMKKDEGLDNHNWHTGERKERKRRLRKKKMQGSKNDSVKQ